MTPRAFTLLSLSFCGAFYAIAWGAELPALYLGTIVCAGAAGVGWRQMQDKPPPLNREVVVRWCGYVVCVPGNVIVREPVLLPDVGLVGLIVALDGRDVFLPMERELQSNTGCFD